MFLKFTKMHGTGNDFVVIDLISQHFKIRSRDVRKLADRHFGLGCDQVLVVDPPQSPDVDFRYRIFNADGNEVEQCGNGARCFARFVREKKLTTKKVITVETCSGVIELRVRPNHDVEVNMGAPHFEPADIRFRADDTAPCYTLQVNGQALEIGALSMGNPHAILRVDSTARADVERLGPLIESHPDFPKKVNAGFMQVVSERELRLRVYERGAGETLACGTGMVACALIHHELIGAESPVEVQVRGGDTLRIGFTETSPHHYSDVTLFGPADFVFQGQTQI